jgi:hypothetical protein
MLRASATTFSRARTPSRRASRMASTDVSVMMPSPPTCTRPRITACPKPLQCEPVSTTASPVSEIDDVAVNSASTSSAPPGPRRATGSASSAVPAAMPIP